VLRLQIFAGYCGSPFSPNISGRQPSEPTPSLFSTDYVSKHSVLSPPPPHQRALGTPSCSHSLTWLLSPGVFPRIFGGKRFRSRAGDFSKFLPQPRDYPFCGYALHSYLSPSSFRSPIEPLYSLESLLERRALPSREDNLRSYERGVVPPMSKAQRVGPGPPEEFPWTQESLFFRWRAVRPRFLPPSTLVLYLLRFSPPLFPATVFLFYPTGGSWLIL